VDLSIMYLLFGLVMGLGRHETFWYINNENSTLSRV